MKNKTNQGLLNISFPWHISALGETDISSRREWSKKSVQQGRSLFVARSVLSVREHGKMARTPLAAFFNIPNLKFHRPASSMLSKPKGIFATFFPINNY
jgi:hypothetical protein